MHGRVAGVRWLTPGLVRVTLTGEGLDGLVMPDATDAYVNVAIAPRGAPYDAVFDPPEVKATHPPETWPARRRYTVRSWDPALRELAVDFVVHGDEGVAGPWAAGAAPGDVLVFAGPSGGYRPDPTADWHLFVGDESALPAIAASLEAVPADVPAVVRLLCDGAEHEVDLSSPGVLDLEWHHRSGGDGDEDLLARSVADLPWLRGRVHAFVHGEAGEIREVRRHLLAERGLGRRDMSCSPYWRRHLTDEAWRAVKRDFVTAMEAEDG